MTVKDYLFRKASRNRIPLGGTFELTPVCNFACHMCYVRKTRQELRNEGFREHTAEEWIRLGRKCREQGMLYLLLTGGEPFLFPDFHYLYESLQNMGLILSLNTNGTLIDEKELTWLKEHAPARVNLTLYGSSPETYGRVCGRPEGYERAVRAVLGLKEAGIQVIINASMIPENAGDMESILDFGKAHDIVVHMSTYMFPPVRRTPEAEDSRLPAEEAGRMGVRKQYHQMDPEAFLRRGRRVLEKMEEKKRQQEEDSGEKQKILPEENWGETQESHMECRAGRSTFWVSWEGKMNPCGIMDFPAVYDPFRKEFRDCWLDLTEKVRQAEVLRECRGCPKKEICHPCAAILYAETGDVNKKAPYLCRMSEAAAACWQEMLKETGGETNDFTL